MQVFGAPVLAFAARRVLQAAAVALLALLSVHAALRLVPGDAVDVMLGEQARPAQRAALRTALGLDRPLPEQLLGALAGLARGDLGTSVVTQRSVQSLIGERAGPTTALAAAALAISFALALPLGIAAGVRPGGRADRASSALAAFGAAAPTFVLGPLLLWAFALGSPHVPVGGYRSVAALLLPSLTLGLGLAALQMRLLRGGIAAAAATPPFAAARARGVGGLPLWWRHALRPTLGPWLTTVGLQTGALLSGAVVTETIFQWPGLGRLLVTAVTARDVPTVQGVVVVFALVHVAASAATDVAVAWSDPRTRRQA